VFSPDQAYAAEFAKKFSCRSVPFDEVGKNSDLLILAIPDSKIAEVAEKLHRTDVIVVHTSGNTPIDVLNGLKKYGVFYPLQTFSKGHQLDVTGFPVCLEACNISVLETLTVLARKISNKVYKINSQQRKFLHLSAVVVNNFSNHLYGMAAEFLEGHDLDFELLKPLIQETAQKIQKVNPGIAQTGPAIRRDAFTIEQQIEMLENDPELLAIYKLFSEQLMKKYNE